MKFNRRGLAAAIAVSGSIIMATQGHAEEQSIIVQSTTSIQNSGLFDYILPQFQMAYGIKVHVVAVGTGQAIKNARNCDGDVLLVHAKAAEERFVSEGYGVNRFDVMHNEFVIVGPAADPAGVAGSNNAAASLERIAQTRSVFASRGDDSGTHRKELSLWEAAGVDVRSASGSWYRETGSGMGATLNVSVGMGAYTMTDRATWMAFRNKGELKIAVGGDKAMFNQYGIVQVSPARCANVKADAAQKFVEWVITQPGQSAIAGYKLDGQQLFFPNAARKDGS